MNGLIENDAERSRPEAKGGIVNAITSLDKQLPMLTYFGFAFWMAWNTITFSGSFWFYDTQNNVKLEDLIVVFLTACTLSQIALAFFSKRVSGIVAKNGFTISGAVLASIGTILIVITRDAIYPSAPLFFFGSIIAGIGTTMVFVRSAALYGALPPRRSLVMMAASSLCSCAIYFTLCACPRDIACIVYILLPLFAASLFCLRSKDAVGESKVLHTHTKMSRYFVALLIFIMLCSCCLELVRAFIVIGIPPSDNFAVRTYSQLLDVLVMVGVIVFVLLTPNHKSSVKLYSTATFALVVLIIIMVAIRTNGIDEAVAASSVTSCYNLTVWAMAAYVIYQAESNAVRIFCFASAALSLGSVIGGLLVSAYYNFEAISEENMRLIMMVFGLIVLASLMFVLSEKRMQQLLLPIEESRLAGDVIGRQEKKPNAWILSCEEIARSHGLSKRETEVFIALARGRTAQEIAEKEVLSVYTVRAHIRSVYAKLDIHSRKDLSTFIEKEIGGQP